ncbi:MAG: hypothetical protein IJ587_12730, partial [Synergistaceae bacterium]|nr:hypothetical protein [Synergistaceae bacterium]
MIPSDILTFLQGQGNLQTGIHQNSGQVQQGIKNGIFDALMAEYTAENSEGMPEIMNTGAEQSVKNPSDAPLMTFRNVRTIDFQTVNINSESVETPETVNTSEALKSDSWKNIFSDAKRAVTPRSERREILPEDISAFEDGVIWEENSDLEPADEAAFKPQNSESSQKADSPVISEQPLTEITRPEIEMPSGTLEPEKAENVPATNRPAEIEHTEQPDTSELTIRAADEIPDFLKAETEESKPLKTEMPETVNQSENSETIEPLKPDLPETVSKIPDVPEKSPDASTKTEQPETEENNSVPIRNSQPPRVKLPDVPENENVEDAPERMKIDSPETRETVREIKAPITPDNDTDFSVTQRAEPLKSEAVNELSPAPKTDDENETAVIIPRKSQETGKDEPEITDINISMAGLAGLQQPQNEPLISDSAPENPENPDAPKTSRISRSIHGKSRADSMKVTAETSSPQTESSGPIQNRTENPDNSNPEPPSQESNPPSSNRPLPNAKNDSQNDIPEKSSPSSRRTAGNSEQTAERSATRRTEAHNDFQSFFDGITRTRRTSSRINTQPLSLRTGTYDSSGIQERGSTLRNGIVNVVR